MAVWALFKLNKNRFAIEKTKRYNIEDDNNVKREWSSNFKNDT